MWLQLNGNFSIIYCFRVITYGNKIQNTLCNSSHRLNRTKGGHTISQLSTLQQRIYITTTTTLLRKFLRVPFNGANFQMKKYKNLLLPEIEIRSVNYGPSFFFHRFMASLYHALSQCQQAKKGSEQ